ncbi:MAG: diguanylate cyclase [Deltaproteobacteria bacterium]|nr:diguanylate cyclase [Deltaproteobacteria bacterium]
MLFYLHIILTFISLIANLILSTVILSVDSRNRLNRLYSVFTLAVAYWSIFKILQITSDSESSAALFYKISSFGWTLLPAIYFSFVLEFTKAQNKVLKKIISPLLFIAGVGFAVITVSSDLMLEGMISEKWGYSHIPGKIYKAGFTPYFITSFVWGLILLFMYGRKNLSRLEKIKTYYLLIGVSVPLLGGVITNMIMPALGIHVFELALTLTSVNVVIIGYAMYRYRLLNITFEYAASTIINTMGDVLIVLDREFNINLVNPAAMHLFRYSIQEFIKKDIRNFLLKDYFSGDLITSLEKEGFVKLEIEFLDKIRNSIVTDTSISTLKDESGETVGYVLVSKDIRERKRLISEIEQAKRELEELAVTDPLTGLHNRRFLMLKLKEEFLRSTRYNKPFSVIILDLDKFKEINDTFGHEEGDELLRFISGKLKSAVRATDVVARFGGDEFVILLPESSKTESIALADRIRMTSFKENLPYKYRIVSGSFGVATFRPDKPLSSEIDLLKLADSALYRSKRLGRDKVSHSDEVGEE